MWFKACLEILYIDGHTNIIYDLLFAYLSCKKDCLNFSYIIDKRLTFFYVVSNYMIVESFFFVDVWWWYTQNIALTISIRECVVWDTDTYVATLN